MRRAMRQPSTFRIHNVSTLSLFNVKWMPRAPLPRARAYRIYMRTRARRRGSFATVYQHGAWMLQAWMLQDAPNHRGTERRGYGVGGNVKGPAAQPRRPNKGHIGYGSGENGTELDALYRALRGERESCSVCALPVMTD